MQDSPYSRSSIIARFTTQINKLTQQKQTPQVTRELRYARAERTAYERGNRMPPMVGTAVRYSEPYAYIVTLSLENTAQGTVFTRTVTILATRRLSLKDVFRRAMDMVSEHMPSTVLRGMFVEQALHHA